MRKDTRVQSGLDMLKAEVSQELGIALGADQTSRNNGAVGGHMVRRLIEIGQSTITNQYR